MNQVEKDIQLLFELEKLVKERRKRAVYSEEDKELLGEISPLLKAMAPFTEKAQKEAERGCGSNG